MFDLASTSTCCVNHSAERKSHFTVWVCMTTLFLKWSNTANFIRVERRGGSERWEERLICICIWSGKCKWTKWSDKRKMWIPLCSYLLKGKKGKTHFFLMDRAFYIPTKCHPIRHLINDYGLILKFLVIFLNCSEQRLVFFVWDFPCFVLQPKQYQ